MRPCRASPSPRASESRAPQPLRRLDARAGTSDQRRASAARGRHLRRRPVGPRLLAAGGLLCGGLLLATALFAQTAALAWETEPGGPSEAASDHAEAASQVDDHASGAPAAGNGNPGAEVEPDRTKPRPSTPSTPSRTPHRHARAPRTRPAQQPEPSTGRPADPAHTQLWQPEAEAWLPRRHADPDDDTPPGDGDQPAVAHQLPPPPAVTPAPPQPPEPPIDPLHEKLDCKPAVAKAGSRTPCKRTWTRS
jgi:hypothetical protein